MKDTPPIKHIDPTKFEMEYDYCCGTTCDKFKVHEQFKHLQDKLTAIQEVVDECIAKRGQSIAGNSHLSIEAIARILTQS